MFSFSDVGSAGGMGDGQWQRGPPAAGGRPPLAGRCPHHTTTMPFLMAFFFAACAVVTSHTQETTIVENGGMKPGTEPSIRDVLRAIATLSDRLDRINHTLSEMLENLKDTMDSLSDRLYSFNRTLGDFNLKLEDFWYTDSSNLFLTFAPTCFFVEDNGVEICLYSYEPHQ